MSQTELRRRLRAFDSGRPLLPPVHPLLARRHEGFVELERRAPSGGMVRTNCLCTIISESGARVVSDPRSGNGVGSVPDDRGKPFFFF